VEESTTVTASFDPVDKKESSGTNAIGESAVFPMPNRDEHFENLLRLVPGVVRGPNSQINMKGARASQNGSPPGENDDLRLAQLIEVLHDAATFDPLRLLIVAGDLNLNASQPRVSEVLSCADFAMLCPPPVCLLLRIGIR
jgi:hypothetical protein